jgi:hypothetical protein
MMAFILAVRNERLLADFPLHSREFRRDTRSFSPRRTVAYARRSAKFGHRSSLSFGLFNLRLQAFKLGESTFVEGVCRADGLTIKLLPEVGCSLAGGERHQIAICFR